VGQLRKNSVGSSDRRSQKRLGADDSKIYCLSLRERAPARISFLSATLTGHFSCSLQQGGLPACLPIRRTNHDTAARTAGAASPSGGFCDTFFFFKKKTQCFLRGLGSGCPSRQGGRARVAPSCFRPVISKSEGGARAYCP